MNDYLQGESHLARFYTGSFRDPEAYRAKAREVADRFHHDARGGALSMLRSPSRAASLRLERWLQEGGVFVTTGQQPGLFGGPLFSLYKALTAVRLAQTLEPILGRPVLALFWMASEDHDWEEASKSHLLDSENRIRTLELPVQEGRENRSLHRIGVRKGMKEAVDEASQILPDSDFSRPYLELIRESYSPGATLPEAFHSLLQGLLEDLPILFVEAHDPRLKEASLPILFQELEAAEEHEALLSRVSSHLEMEGYHTQVPVLEAGVNLFLEGPRGRDRLYREEGGFRLHRASVSLSAREIRERCREDPRLLSPNVLLRPVVESALFPTVSYVAGPGEVAYYAQLRELFEAHDLVMPVIHPRHSVTLLERKIGKVLEKFHLPVETLARPHHELAGEMAREEIPPEIRKSLGEIRGAVGKGSGTLARAVKELDPTLKGPVTHARNAAFAAFDEAERKILQAVKRENEIALEQLAKAQNHLFPLGKPQERITNPLYYLARYGPELIDALLERFDVDLDTETR